MEITRIRDKYADILAEQQAIREKNFEIMQTFATEHREEEVAGQLSKCGMVVVQDESFYVEPKKENEQPA